MRCRLWLFSILHLQICRHPQELMGKCSASQKVEAVDDEGEFHNLDLQLERAEGRPTLRDAIRNSSASPEGEAGATAVSLG